ncbi:MAG: DUF4335 domain-containing protein [Chloroflexaceae bacterium]|nr:DUF4335 domain-containing protein [Chloroflexaceae bacterium]
MTIRRQYLLPNCNLIVEGLSSQDESAADRPLLAIAINVECHFQGRQQILSGGKAFIQNLTAAASAYAQEYLSGLPRSQEPQTEEDRVQIQPREGRHCLIWQPGSKGQAQPVEIELATMELFDLVEAIDQLAADRQTLPDLQLSLEPLHRRHRRPEEPLTQRAAPLAMAPPG